MGRLELPGGMCALRVDCGTQVSYFLWLPKISVVFALLQPPAVMCCQGTDQSSKPTSQGWALLKWQSKITAFFLQVDDPNHLL